MVKTKGGFECRNDDCDVIEVRGGYRTRVRVIREARPRLEDEAVQLH